MASNNAMDLLAEARVASLTQRARSQRADVLPAAAALRLATLGSAEALRLDDRIGSLEVGKQADLVAFGVPDAAQPVEDPEAALVFAHAALRVRRVVVAGVSRVRDGAVLGLDPTTALRVADAARRVSEWRRAHHAG